MLRDKIRFPSPTQRVFNTLMFWGRSIFFNPLQMRNFSPSSSKSDAILLDLGSDFPFRGLFLALLLPSPDLDLDLDLGLDLYLVRQLAGTNHCHFPPFYKKQLLDLRLISCPTYSDPSTSITSNIFLGWLAIITLDADGKTIQSLRKIECTFASRTSVYKRLYKKKSSRTNKMRTGNKTKNISRIKIIEAESSCCGFYMSYRGAKSIPQGLRSQSQAS